jgi:hypothetical protein
LAFCRRSFFVLARLRVRPGWACPAELACRQERTARAQLCRIILAGLGLRRAAHRCLGRHRSLDRGQCRCRRWRGFGGGRPHRDDDAASRWRGCRADRRRRGCRRCRGGGGWRRRGRGDRRGTCRGGVARTGGHDWLAAAGRGRRRWRRGWRWRRCDRGRGRLGRGFCRGAPRYRACGGRARIAGAT